MEIKKTNFSADLVLDKDDVETIIGVFEELAMHQRRPLDSWKGKRREIYEVFVKIVK